MKKQKQISSRYVTAACALLAGHSVASAGDLHFQMPVASVHPAYLLDNGRNHNLQRPRLDGEKFVNGEAPSYVFLQKFPLGHSNNLFFHTEVLVCPQENFSKEDRAKLDDMVSTLTDFAQVDDAWWNDRTAECVELGYGGANCSDECCSVPQTDDQLHFPLNARRAMISNALTEQKSLYLYGVSSFDGVTARHDVCDKKCWSNWSGVDYNPLTNNCNTFTSTVLFCVFGLSQKKPNLGPSDMVTVHGHCPAETVEEVRG